MMPPQRSHLSYARRAKDLLQKAGLAPKKSWGQNFLMDDQVLHDIVRAANVAPGGTVVELGAGLGALTLALLEQGIHVEAIERDRDLIPLLQALCAEGAAKKGTLTVTPADAAKLDYPHMAARLGQPLHVLGNLPYQLSGRILVSMSDCGPAVQDGVVLVQREVAQRLCAEPGSKSYGLLTVLLARSFVAHTVRDVPPAAFLPPPKVHSSVVRLEGHQNPPWAQLVGVAASEDALRRAYVAVAKAAFHTRRKTLQNALGLGLRASKEAILEVLAQAEIDGGLRAEVLSPEQFARLGCAAHQLGLVSPSAKDTSKG